MQRTDIIRAGIAYIEQNLKADITIEELADMSGYSVWHYQRLFAQVTGVSLTKYINKLRLDRALAEIAANRKAIDAALDYGFDSYAGFYKAFLRMYGCSPKKYLFLYGTHQSISEVSIMLTENELREVLRNWDIPQDLPINDVKIVDGTKTANNVWQVGKSYYLKTGDRSMLLLNARIAKAMEVQGLAAAVPVPTKKGCDFTEEQNSFMLTQRLKGEPLSKTNRFGADYGDFGYKYGQSIARLHNALTEVEEDIQPFEQNLYAHVAEWALPNVQKQNIQWNMGIPDSFFEKYNRDFGMLFEKLPKQLIHRDRDPNKFCVKKNKELPIRQDLSQEKLKGSILIMEKTSKELLKEFVNSQHFTSTTDIINSMKELFSDVLQEVMEAALEEKLGYEKSERVSDKAETTVSKNYRNGYSKKTVKTQLGEVDVKIPRDRNGEYEPQIIGKYNRNADGMEEKILALYSCGMSQRDISEQIKNLYNVDISDGLVSKIVEKITPEITAWQNRPLEAVYPFVFMDAIHYKVKENHQYITKAAYVVLGIQMDGRKDILGVWIGENESSKFWLSVMNDLRNRGVNDVYVFCVDGLSGFREAINAAYPKSQIQRCIIHQIRSSTRYVSYKDIRTLMADLKKVYQAVNEDEAMNALLEFKEKWQKSYPSCVKSWEENWDIL